MTDYKILIPEIEDIEGIIEMHVQSWLDVYPNDEHGVSRELVADWVKRFTNEDGHKKRRLYVEEARTNPDYYFRIVKNPYGKVLGFIDARRGKNENELGGLYVDKTEYGKGLAQQFTKDMMKWLGNDKSIRLTVATYNNRAKAFYRKIGFEIVLGSEHLKKDTTMPIVEMIRKGDKK